MESYVRGSPKKRLLVYVFGPKHLASPYRRLWGQIVAIFSKYRSIPSHRKKIEKIRRRKKYFFSLWSFGFRIFPSFLKDSLIGAYKRILNPLRSAGVIWHLRFTKSRWLVLWAQTNFFDKIFLKPQVLIEIRWLRVFLCLLYHLRHGIPHVNMDRYLNPESKKRVWST